MSSITVVDGMTGVGKSSLVNILSEELDLIKFEEIFRDEHDLLAKFHYEGKKWCLAMQINFLTNRFNQYRLAMQADACIMDRSIFSDPIFAMMYRDNEFLSQEEYSVYENLFNSLVESLDKPRLIIYLSVSPRECIRRIRKRGRPDELAVDDNYWQKLLSYYNSYYRKFKGNNKTSKCLWIDVSEMDYVHNKQDRYRIVELVRDALTLAEPRFSSSAGNRAF